jgi:hypothetical protein
MRVSNFPCEAAEEAASPISLIKELSIRLSGEFGKGFSPINFSLMRKFFLLYRDRRGAAIFQTPFEISSTESLLIGGGEHAGSGVARIKQGWASRHGRSPSLELTRQPDRVRLSLPMVSLIPEEALAGMRQIFGTDLDGLAAEELQAIATAYIERCVTNARTRYTRVESLPRKAPLRRSSLPLRGLFPKAGGRLPWQSETR